MIKRFFILLLAIVASVGMSFAQDPGIVSSGTKGGMSYTFYDNGLLEISGSGALPGQAFTNWDGGFGTSVKNIRFAEDCEVYGLDYLWFGCYTENSQLETVEINSVAPILFSGTSGAGIFYRQDGAVTITITAPGIVDVENRIIDNYGSPVNMIFNMPATTVFERKWFSGLENYFAVTIPTGAKGHIPAGYVFKDSYDQEDYDHLVADGYEEIFWDSHSHLVEGVDYTLGVESTFVITAENASQIFGKATVSFQAPTEASNSEWVLWRKSDLKTFSDMSSGDKKVYKDVTVKVNNGVYNTDSGYGVHFDSSDEDGVQFVAPEGKVFKRIVILNEYGTFSDPNWSYDKNYKRWSGSANTVGFVGNICGISLIEFELEASAPANSCGGGLTWELNNGELVISYDGEGTGVMNDYDIPNDNPAPWYANREDITSVSLPEGIKTIGKDAFRDCVNLTTVTIPNSVTTIGESAFVTVEHLETVTIGTGITSIVNGAFYGNAELTTVTCSATTPPSIGAMVFDGCPNLEHIYVPTESVDAYKTAWSDYASLISAPPANSITINGTPQVGDNSISLTYYFDPANVPGLDEGFAPTLKVKCVTDNKWDEIWLSSSEISSGTTTITLEELVSFQEGKSYDVCFAYNNGDWVDDVFQSFSFAAPAPAYETVMNLINAIGTVELTAECKAKIDEARAAFIALSDGDKAQVTNIATLTTAEAAFENVMDIWLSGDCDVILWSDTTLTVRKHAGEGNGAMADYDYMSRAPWYSSHWYNPQPNDIVIKSVTVEEGVTHLGDYAFAWMSEMKTVTIPASVTTIPEDAFYWSKAVDDIYFTADPSDLTWALPNTADVQFKPEKGTRCHVPADLLTAYQEKFGTLNVTFVGDLDPITPLTPEQQQALDAAKGLINAIPSPVVYTPACKDAIDAARAAYDALTPDMLKQLVSNYATLTAAEATYANLKDVAVVEAKIAAIPQPVTLKLATRDSIESARAAYDALTADQKLLVSNYQTLLDAEAALAAIGGGGGSAPDGALNGKFTINAGGDQIAFSKGNLQATTEDLGEHWTWGFAANQWNYLGIAVANSKINGNGTVSENGTVDLFGWSTAATYYGINNSYKAVDYIGDFVDWGPKMGAGWRTLTKDEWNYLIENNTKGRATVNEKNGYIFLPDNWSGPAFTPDPDNFTTNVYSGDDWTAMENAGAVFLPSGPARNGTYALIANDAKYSSSTSLNSDTSYVFTIYYNQSQSACTGTNRAYGCMVRLVTEGGGATPLDSAQAVKDLIEAIPMPVTLEDACVNAVQAASDAYNALSDAAKGALDAATVKKLTNAEAALTALNQAEADKVIAKINNIPLPVELKLATRDSIQNARTAYDALNAAQEALVTNYQTLLDAEAALAALNLGVPPATPLDSAQAVKDLIDAIPTPVEYPTSGPAIAAALVAYNQLSDAAKGALDDADVQKMTDAATQYAALDAIAAIEAIPAEIVYDPAVKAAIETAREKYDALIDASKALVDDEVVAKLTNAEEAWAILVAKIEHNVSYIGKDGELKNEIVALLHIPDPAPDFNGYEFVRWDVKGGDFLEEGLRIKAVYTPIITTNPQGFDTLAYNGLAQELVKAGVAKEGHIEYSLYPEEPESWSAELPKATNAGVYAIYYKLVREGHADYIASEPTMATIAKVPVTYVAPTAVESLVYTASNQTLIAAGQTQDGTFEYSLDPTLLDSWTAELPQAKDAGTYSVYYRVQGDLNHLDSVAATPVAVTIAKAELTATADDKNVIYGDAVPAYTVTYAGWQGNDDATVLTGDIAFACEYAATSNVGEYTITPSGATAANYTITFVNGKVTVAQAALMITAEDKNVTYGDAAPEYTATYSGWKNTDGASVVSGLVYTCEYAPTSNVGEYTIVPSGATATNYNISYTHGKVTVAQAALMITADDKSVEYGEVAPAFTASYSGWKNSDDASVVSGLTLTSEYLVTSNVGTYDIVPANATATNYAISYTKGTLTVNQAPLMITADDKSVIYGDAVPEYTATYSGWKNSDDASVVSGLVYTCEYAPTSNVGEYTITPSDATATNYAISYTNGKVTVAQATLTVTADDKSVTYGDAAPAFTATYSGWKNTDEASVVSGLTLTSEYLVTSNVGTYDIVPANATALNYTFVYVNGTLTVNKAALMITADDKSVEYGEVAPAFTASYSGWKNTDNESVVSGLTLTSEYLVTSNVGTYDIVPANASATNYAISYTNGTLTVNQAALTITAENKEMIYGDEHPEFTASYSGWKNTDDESVVSGLAYTTPYAPGSPIGTYTINPNSATALNYAITFVDGTLTVNKAHVYVSGAEVHTAKFADGHANAEVTNQGTLNGIKLNDPIAHVTTASFSSADVAEHLTITLFYELTGSASLLNNYNLDPTSEIFTTEGVIIEPFIPDNEDEPEDKEATVNEGIEIYAYGYCDGSGYSLKYHLESGNPDQYKIDFADSRFTDVDWTNLEITGKDGTIDIEIPVDLPTGDYTMTVYFRDSRFDWLESRQFNVTFHVNLPETYIRPLFENVIALIDTCNCLTDIQWYWRANSNDTWVAIPGANGYYYHSDTKLAGEYFVSAKMNGEPTYTCGQADMETLYGDDTPKAQVKAYPNPVIDRVNVTIEGSEAWTHTLRVVSLMGSEVINTNFDGNETTIEMIGVPQGNYMISVDGIVVKVMKK